MPQEANFDDIVMEQVLGEPANILLEQFDAFLDVHLGQLVDLQAGQFPAGLVQSVEFLLLLHFRGDVPAQADELVNLAGSVGDGRDIQFEVLIIAAVEASDDRLADERGMKRTEIGAQNVGMIEGLVKILAPHGPGTAFLEGRIGPKNAQVRLHDGHAFAEDFENVIILKPQGRIDPGRGEHQR